MKTVNLEDCTSVKLNLAHSKYILEHPKDKRPKDDLVIREALSMYIGDNNE